MLKDSPQIQADKAKSKVKKKNTNWSDTEANLTRRMGDVVHCGNEDNLTKKRSRAGFKYTGK